MSTTDREHGDHDLGGQHDEAGVDLTQIDMMLALTPKQRLDMLFATASSLARLMPVTQLTHDDDTY